MFEVTLVPILLAGIANVILGMAWYHPKVFGDSWAKAAGLDMSKMEEGKKKMPMMAFLAFLAAVVAAWVMAHFGIAWGVYDWIGAIELGIWSWVGFTAPVLLGSVLWEMKPMKYFFITAGYWLVSFIVMALILVLFA